MSDDDLVAIALIVKPRGLRGECVAELLTDFPERFEETESVTAILPDGTRRGLKIESFRFQKDRVNLMFQGVSDPDAADSLRGAEICVPAKESVELEAGEFFDWELEGCRVETIDGTELGSVKELMRTGGPEILVVAGAEKEYLVPFAEAICIEVDVEKKLIKVDPPIGLLDF